MVRRIELLVPPERDGATVKSLLRRELKMAEGHIAALKLWLDGLTVAGERVNTNRPLRAGELLQVRIDDGEARNPAAPVAGELCFRYEDEDLAVLEKPAGLVVHGVPGGPPTLGNLLAAHWGPEQPFHPVHRLDRGTSGLLVLAKSAYVSELLRRRLHTEDFQRGYLALCGGELSPEAGRIELPLGPAPGERLRRTVRADGQPAVTDYETLERFSGGSLLRLRLHTGRTHQIRAQLACLGCPLLGDELYGGPRLERLNRPALHAAYLLLRQPVTGERIELFSPLPEDLQRVLNERKE